MPLFPARRALEDLSLGAHLYPITDEEARIIEGIEMPVPAQHGDAARENIELRLCNRKRQTIAQAGNLRHRSRYERDFVLASQLVKDRKVVTCVPVTMQKALPKSILPSLEFHLSKTSLKTLVAREVDPDAIEVTNKAVGTPLFLAPPEQATRVHLISNIGQVIGPAVGHNRIALGLELLKVVRYLAAEKLGCIQRWLVVATGTSSLFASGCLLPLGYKQPP